MQYRNDAKSGNKLSVLGFGCMRFPKKMNQIDIAKTEEMMIKAVNDGVNYFDTAFLYNDSENVLGSILAKNKLREKIFIATKIPPTKCNTFDDFETIFKTQLERLRTEYIDYYLIHSLIDIKAWEKLCAIGIEKWIKEKKASGQIRNIGFSFHGIQGDFMKLLDVYDWNFCQIQYNYLDENYQAGVTGLKKAFTKNMPVIIMEPLLGGKLANGLPKKVVNIYKSSNKHLTPAAWALRWLWNQKEVTVVLSGMSDMPQLIDNIETAKGAVSGMLTEAENETYENVLKMIRDSYKIPCTGCNYCMPCPQGVNIPGCFSAYNTSYSIGLYDGLKQYVTSTGLLDPLKNFGPGNCVKCGACEKKCPQNIPVIKSLKNVTKRMEPLWIKAFLALYFKFTR